MGENIKYFGNSLLPSSAQTPAPTELGADFALLQDSPVIQQPPTRRNNQFVNLSQTSNSRWAESQLFPTYLTTQLPTVESLPTCNLAPAQLYCVAWN